MANFKDILEKTQSYLDSYLDAQIKKNEDVLEKIERKDGTIERKSVFTDPNLETNVAAQGLYKPRYSHISLKTLKEMSLRDPLVSAIIQTRVNQVVNFSTPQETKYDTGYRFRPRDISEKIERGSKEWDDVKFLEDMIRYCGRKDPERRPEDEQMSFQTFLRLVIRDRLTYGAVAIEKILDKRERLHHFLPVPTETIYYANKNADPELAEKETKTWNLSYASVNKEIKPQSAEDFDLSDWKDYKFVQVTNGKAFRFFRPNELIYKLGNPVNFIDANGYAIGELELATKVITAHLQAENYNQLFFTQGHASRGILHIKGDIAPAQLQAFRSQWMAQITGNMNSWRTPVVAGADEIQWIPLAASNRDMEYSAYMEHIIRILTAIFQISPAEIGFEYLSQGGDSNPLQEANNEYKITASKDRGLKPLLHYIEDLINEDIMPSFDPKLAEKYKFEFVGLNAETRMQERERLGEEVKLYRTMNDVLAEMNMPDILGGNVILNQDYLNFLFKTHKIGEIREDLLGYKGEKVNPEWDYVADAYYFQHLQAMMEMAMGEGEPESDGEPPQSNNKSKSAPRGGDKNDKKPAPKADTGGKIKKSESIDSHVDEFYDRIISDYDDDSANLVNGLLNLIKEEYSEEHDHDEDSE